MLLGDLPCNMRKTHGTRNCLQGIHHTPRSPLEIGFIVTAIAIVILIVVIMKVIIIIMVTIGGSSMGSMGGVTS